MSNLGTPTERVTDVEMGSRPVGTWDRKAVGSIARSAVAEIQG